MENFSPFLGTIIGNIVVAIWIIIVVFVSRLIKDKLNNYLDYITATTVWLLLWIIFLGFIPELANDRSMLGEYVWVFLLLWVFLFYLLELFLHWHHCKDLGHHSSCDSHNSHQHKSGVLMFGGTFLHNFLHGIVLFSAFSIDLHFWIATTFAVLLHSIPQNIVNYVMNHKNITYAYIAAFWWVFWALITFPFADFLLEHKLVFLSIIAGWLLYTALADIFPEFKWKWTTKEKLVYFIFLFLGITLFFWFNNLALDSHSHWDEHEIHDEGYSEIHDDEDDHDH